MFYKHYKGRYYQVIGYVTEANSDAIMVVYTPLYHCEKTFFVREQGNFFEHVIYNNKEEKRFIAVEKHQLPEETHSYIIASHEIGGLFFATQKIQRDMSI